MSLVTTPTSQLGRCGTCASHRVTAITMTLTDGSVVDFLSCHSCESKTWSQGGTPLAIDAVLGKARKIKPQPAAV